MCGSYGPPSWTGNVWLAFSCSIFLLLLFVLANRPDAKARTEPQRVEDPDSATFRLRRNKHNWAAGAEDPDPATLEDALPQSYITG